MSYISKPPIMSSAKKASLPPPIPIHLLHLLTGSTSQHDAGFRGVVSFDELYDVKTEPIKEIKKVKINFNIEDLQNKKEKIKHNGFFNNLFKTHGRNTGPR